MSVRIKEPDNTRDWRKFIEEMGLTGFSALCGNIPGICKGIRSAIEKSRPTFSTNRA